MMEGESVRDGTAKASETDGRPPKKEAHDGLASLNSFGHNGDGGQSEKEKV
jgi:hypothetical protein